MAARSLNVYISIGAKVSSSVGASVRAVGNQLQGLTRRVQLANAQAKAQSRGLMTSGDIRGAVFDSVAIGYGLYRAAKPFVDFEDQLIRVGNTAQVYGARLKAGGVATLNAGKMYGFGAEAALTGLNDFVSAGLVSGKLDTFDTALGALPKTLQLAKTAGIEVGEASQSAISVIQNLGVNVTDLGKAFDYMAAAGKEGRFELNDMAKEFPSLTSYASQLGMKGLDGVQRLSAMLQVTRMNARDSEEAANNLVNFFQKATGKETTQHFAKMGVNLENVWKKAKASGTDYVDALLNEIAKLSKNGEDTFVLNKLFPDRQANQAVTALIKNRKEYNRIRDAVRSAAGVLDGDWNRVSKTTKTSMERLGAALKSIAITFGAAVGPQIADAAEKLAKLSGEFANFAEKNPETIAAISKAVAALGGLLIIGKIGSIVATGVSRIVIAGRWLWAVVNGATGIVAAARWLRGALVAFELFAAVLGAPFGLAIGIAAAAIALLAGAIGWVIAKWDGIKAFFAGFADGFMKALGPEARAGIEAAGTALKDFGTAIGGAFSWAGEKLGGLVGWIKDLFHYIFGPPDTANWKSFGEQVGGWVGGVANGIANLIKLIGDLKNAISNNLKLPDDWKSRLQTGIRTGIGNVGGAGVSVGQAPGAGAGSIAGQAISGARARGGPVRRGGVYQINERGQELFAPGQSGSIINARATAALLAANGNSPRAANSNGDTYNFNISGAHDPQATAREVERVMKRYARGQRAALND